MCIRDSYNVVNIVLLGHDNESLGVDEAFRTDTMIVVNINLTTNTVAMLSLPRDLVVWVAGWGMHRLNLAWGRGEAVGWTDGGWGLFRQTVLYNFGIELHYYALVDFTGFKTLIDRLNGVTIGVDCPIQDYLFTGEYDAQNQPIFELTTLPVGVHTLNSREALWYARSRRNSSDFDRGRRQQQILRAMWSKGREANLLTQLPSLWAELSAITQTNLSLPILLELVPLGLNLAPNDIENHFFRLGIETSPWTSPDGDNVQVPNGAMITLIQNFLTPPTQNQVVADAARIEIWDGSGTGRQMDVVAAERLLWEGLLAVPMGAESAPQAETTLIDYSGDTKGSSLQALVTALNISPSNVTIQPDPNRTVDYRIVLGENYNSCVDRQVQIVEEAPPVTATPRP
jgi:LCP family protein required for cell wall assembly